MRSLGRLGYKLSHYQHPRREVNFTGERAGSSVFERRHGRMAASSDDVAGPGAAFP